MIPSFPRVLKRPHHIYKDEEISEILEYLTRSVLPRGALAKISRDTGIPDSTLAEWHRKRKEDGNWFPLSEGRPSKRALAQETEQWIYDHLRSNFIDPGLGATRGDLKTLALNAYSSLPVDEMRVSRFCASDHYLADYERRWNLSLRSPHHERRTKINKAYVKYFLRRLGTMLDDYPGSRIFNIDETAWRLFTAPGKVLAEKGSETVKLQSQKGEKESFTAIGGICSDGTKLPIWVIAKGKTIRTEAKFGQHPDVLIRHTPSGWTTEQLLAEYLRWLHDTICDGEPCALVLDLYPAHRTRHVWETAAENDIELLYVPAGATGEFQPLDRRIFGELKSRARREFSRSAAIDGARTSDYHKTMQVLIECWARVSGKSVQNAWELIRQDKNAPTGVLACQLTRAEQIVLQTMAVCATDSRPYVSYTRLVREAEHGTSSEGLDIPLKLITVAARKLAKKKFLKVKGNAVALSKSGKVLAPRLVDE